MKRLPLLFIFCANVALAGELPSEFTGADTFAEQFRSFLTSKITQMDQNFIRVARGKELFYRSSESVTCLNGVKASPRQKLFRIYYTQSLENKEYSENRFYHGCDNKIAFTETYRARGVEAPVHGQKEIFSGEMRFKFDKEADFLSYKLSDGQGDPVFEISYNREQAATYLVLKMEGEKILSRQVKKDEKETLVRYFPHPYDFKMSRNRYHLTMKSGGMFKGFVSASITENNVKYYNSDRERVSMAAFQSNFQFPNLNVSMESLLAALPKTEFVTSNMQGGKMLEELRNAQTFLISGTQLNLVRNLVEEYIKAVQEGAIVDRRK